MQVELMAWVDQVWDNYEGFKGTRDKFNKLVLKIEHPEQYEEQFWDTF